MRRIFQPAEREDEASLVGSLDSTTAIGKILLVDDDRDLVETLSFGLRKAGFTPLPASDPAVAIQRFEGEAPDVVVLDVELDASSGLEVLNELRKRSDLPILMMTGCASDKVEARSFELGADDYLQKPVSIASLIVRVRAVLARSSRTREQAESHVQLNAALRELVTARERALAAAEQAARAHDEGLALAVHDLLEPLTVIRSLAQLQHRRSLRAGVSVTEPVIQTLAHIEANASMMAEQLVELLGSTRLEIDQVLELAPTRKVFNAARRRVMVAPHDSPPLSAA